MNRRTSAIVAVSLVCSALAAQPAKAQMLDHAFETATGIAGGLVDGVMSGAATVANAVTPAPGYDARIPPPSAGVYAEQQPICRIRRVRAWDGHAWYFRSVEVCG